MALIGKSLLEALHLIVSGDPTVLDAALRSVWISGLAVCIAALVGLPLGTLLARVRVPGRRFLILMFRAAMAAPTVFVGLICYALFSRNGPLGPTDWLYTPWVIVVGEFMLALPLIVSITHGAVKSMDWRVAETAWTLGVGPLRRWVTYWSEARVGIMLAIVTAYARCVTELGIAMMVGGNIRGRTQTLATATAMETGKGDFTRGLAMGLILLIIALAVTAVIVMLGREDR
jgi:tungstate transport system permease protein